RWLVAASVAFSITAVLIGRSISGQQTACLHGQTESADQAMRRQQALALTRRINTLEARNFSAAGAFQSLAQLGIHDAVPQGFTAHLATDGTSYAFSLRDSLDACRFGYFS